MGTNHIGILQSGLRRDGMREVNMRRRSPCRRRGAFGLALLCAAGILGPSTGAQAQRDLTSKVQILLTNTKLGSSKVGVSIRDLDTSTDLADINADTPLMPASSLRVPWLPRPTPT